MLKIFRTYVNAFAWWFIISAINYKWPSNSKYASWNLFTIDSAHFYKIFSLGACFFIASCYGYLQKTRDEDIKTMEELKIQAQTMQDLLDKKRKQD